MITPEGIKEISLSTPSKIVLVVMDGLGGLPLPETGKTELETASTPNMDRLAQQGVCGLTEPVSPGVTPGSCPAHLSLFGYDPFRFLVGRGVVEALGIDLDLQAGDIAARGNFCTVDDKGLISDRRAGRLSTERCAELCRLLSQIKLEGAELLVVPVKEHRFVVVLRGQGLKPELLDSDPQREGVAPLSVLTLDSRAKKTATMANDFVSQSQRILSSHSPANMVLLRGFSRRPTLPSMAEIYKLKAAAIAAYPMYRGLAKLVGMTVLNTGSTMEEELETLRRHYADFDFFFLHIKGADAAGEDGDFTRKVRVIEGVDAIIPRILALKPDVLIVTGDHSTPAVLKGHSWHPVPFLLHSRWCRYSPVAGFSERECARGELGRFSALETMPLALAHALKLQKFGA